MQCPRCQSKHLRKNGMSAGKQRYLCRKCGRTFFGSPSLEVSSDVQTPSVHADLPAPSSDSLSFSHQSSVQDVLIDSSSVSNSLIANPEGDRKFDLQLDLQPEVESELRQESSVFLNTIALDHRELLTLYKSLEANFIRLFKQQEKAGISILLLDVENIQLTAKAEKFLATLCHYPLQIKIAFGNWRRLANWDEEFHSRGYQMIHVPGGKDSADAKMTAVGASIFLQYPNVKEVLVCSSDWGLTHLYNSLQTHGITTYLVKENKEERKIVVSNSQSNQVEVYSLLLSQSLPSLEEFLESVQEIVIQQQRMLNQAWTPFNNLSDLYYQATGFTVTEVLQKHFPGKHLAEFLQESGRFAFHQSREPEKLFITIFQVPPSRGEDLSLKTEEKLESISVETPDLENLNSESSSATDANLAQQKSTPENVNQPTLAELKIQSMGDLEQLLVEILKTLTNQEPEKYVQMGMFGTAFRNSFGEPISTTLKRLESTGKFIEFIQARPHLFKLKKEKDQNYVAVNFV